MGVHILLDVLYLYLAVVQTVLIFGSEIWVMSPRIWRTQRVFCQRVIFRLIERQPIRQADKIWYYPPLVAAIEETGLEYVETYVARF